MMIEEKVGTLEEEGLKRKERLKALKRKQDENDAQSKKAKNNNVNAIPKPVFRSYLPKDEKLKETTLPPAKPGDVKSEIKDQLESAKTRVVIEELDLANLAPRKPDWDLKRDVAKKLDKLEKRTQKAIAELIRDRLKNEQTDLATQVAIGASAI